MCRDPLRLDIACCGGDERLLLPQILRHADAVLVVFSMLMPSSFVSGVPFWNNEALRCVPGAARWLLAMGGGPNEGGAEQGGSSNARMRGHGGGASMLGGAGGRDQGGEMRHAPGIQYASDVAMGLGVGFLPVTPVGPRECWNALHEVAEDLYRCS